MTEEFNTAALPANIHRLWKAISREAGYDVEWTPDDREEADMIAEWHGSQPIIFHNSESVAGAARELIHLRLDLRGYPAPNLASAYPYAVVVEFLQQLLRRSMSFPAVRKMGYQPEPGGCHWVSRWQLKLVEELPAVCREHTSPFEVLVALHLAHARRFCGPAYATIDLAPIDRDERFERARVMAEQLDRAIDLDDESTAVRYRQVLTRCMEILGLDGQVVGVDPRVQDQV